MTDPRLDPDPRPGRDTRLAHDLDRDVQPGSAPPLDPALDRALLAARDRRERRGAAGDATVVVVDLTPQEALALDGLLSISRRAPVLPGQSLRVPLSRFEDALRAGGRDPRIEYERVGGRPLRDLPAERAAHQTRRAGFSAWLADHEVVHDRPCVRAWLEQAAQQGRITPDMCGLVQRALEIVAALPAREPLQRTVLAARMLDGDPHALDVGTPLHNLTLALLAADARLDRTVSPRQVWAAFNVLVDPVSSFVATLNLPLSGDGDVKDVRIAPSMARAPRGVHAILTYGQLSAAALHWPTGVTCFSCENPSVLIAAERTLGAACPPLVCTGGRPSDAVRLVLDAVAQAGAPILHHGDFDESGVQILHDLVDRHGARAWRFDVKELRAALVALDRPPVPCGSDLLKAVRSLPSPVPEELLLDDLLADLSAAVGGAAPG